MRRASERSPSAEFVPLSAEFAAQLTLFGAPQRAPSPAAGELHPLAGERPSPLPAGQPAAPDRERAPVAAFERRAQLRQERGRLVAELHRRDGRGHREINTWVNRAVGLERVEGATILQLERSIQALERELTRLSRSPRLDRHSPARR